MGTTNDLYENMVNQVKILAIEDEFSMHLTQVQHDAKLVVIKNIEVNISTPINIYHDDIFKF